MPRDNDRFEVARWHAEQQVLDRQLKTLPVDPFTIARASTIEVRPMPSLSGGVSGMLCKAGDKLGILYATHIDSEGFQRFSVAHELGHYFLPGHVDHLFDEGKTEHQSRSGFISGDPFELEADHFAASLLMPRRLFSAAMFKAGEGLPAVESLSIRSRTSLTATAIRYAELTERAIAVVVSTAGRVDYCVMSEPFKEIRGLEWLRKGAPVPVGTPTYAFGKDQAHVTRAERIQECSRLSDWFGGRRHMEVNEDVVGLGRYAKILTILYADQLDEIEEYDESDDDDWEPLTFHRSRRRP